jgi:cobalt-zinc-cadmium efflux system protein
MHHSHNHFLKSLEKAFIYGILLNASFVVVEFVSGFYFNSLALLSDAGHNLSDVATLALSLLALQVAKRKATARYTYGFQKGTILASLVNAVILLLAVGSIGWEAIQRFIHPVNTRGSVISIVAGIGIVINAASALLFFKSKEKDLNARGAFLHLALDTLVSLGVVVAGVAIFYTGLTWIDPLISLIIMSVVIYSTWGLLTESLKLSMDAVPSGIDVELIKAEIMKQPEIKAIYHVHIWGMGTTKNAMTAHLVLVQGQNENSISALKERLRQMLNNLNIQHVTLETEQEA